MSTILVVDDEEKIRTTLKGFLEEEGYRVCAAPDGESALSAIRKSEPDLMLLDIAMPGLDGMEVLRRSREIAPGMVTLMVSAFGNVDTAVKATKLGAYHFIEKPFDVDQVLRLIENALEAQRQERARLQRPKAAVKVELTGANPAIVRLRETLATVAPTHSSVLISGENGTGKEVVARLVHALSRRAEQRFVQVNCAAIPEDLIESELFGYEKGAFTGADRFKPGRFDLAHGGTMFLDEIGDMSLRTQAKILRILQERTFERVGGTTAQEVDVRVLAASNKVLEEEIRQRRFREDLYYRLNVIPLSVPPLRERAEDIPALVRTFLEEFHREGELPMKEVSEEVMRTLEKYPWPGNVRELKNAVERLVVLSKGARIEAGDLPAHFQRSDVSARKAMFDDIRDLTLREARRNFERRYIQEKLEEFGYHVGRTAQAIGIDRAHLWRKIKQYDIPVRDPDAPAGKPGGA
ncbi:MAG: sigma-54-dependent Fis family transcriptional regulator [Nitrospirae bacterium]|nr:sigma-54-dependent Fis family transcriptional regulator [Nitrospirota bacterium]